MQSKMLGNGHVLVSCVTRQSLYLENWDRNFLFTKFNQNTLIIYKT